MSQLCLDPRAAQGPSTNVAGSPFVSVIVPVRNEATFIRPTLESLLSQEYDSDRFEVIVVDGESIDGTPDIVRSMQAQYPNLRFFTNPSRWSSAGRNIAVRAARGDYLVLVDGHSELDNPCYLENLADAFSRSGADCIGRPQPLDVNGATPLQRAIAAARSSWLGHHPASWIYDSRERFVKPQSVGVAYRREVFDTVGFFDEDFDACEDVEFNHRVDRAGLHCFFTPKVQVRYVPRASLRGLFQQLCRYGRGRIRLLRKHPETFSLASMTPAVFLLVLIASVGAAWFVPWLATVGTALLALYAPSILIASATLTFKARDMRLLPWLPPVFFAIHSGAGAGVLMEAARQVTRRLLRPREIEKTVSSSTIARRRAVPYLPLRAGVLEDHGWNRGIIDVNQTPTLNALTVDVEDYFQVTGFETLINRRQWDEFESRVSIGTERILRALDSASVRATFFVLGWVAERNPRLVRQIRASGHEAGCHSYWHQLVYRQTPDEFRADLRRARRAIEDAIGTSVFAYRAPCFSITRRSLWALDILIEEGFRFDSSIYPTLHDRYGIPGAPHDPHEVVRPAGTLWEFPMAVHRFLGYPMPVGGGGYLRLYPYAITRHMLRAINRAGRPFVVYLHPWELDPDQPRLRTGRLTAFRHYVNLHRAEARLKQLLSDFRFGTISQIHAELNSAGNFPRWEPSRAA